MNSASMNDNERMMIEKSVRFEENTSFRTVEHQRDMTADHRDLLWYNVSSIGLCSPAQMDRGLCRTRKF